MTITHTSNLAYNVSGLLRQPVGATRSYELEQEEIALDENTCARAVTGDVRLLRITTGILAEGRVTATVELECSRCVEPTQVIVEASLEEEFRPSIDILTGTPLPALLEGEIEGDFSRIASNHILDLIEVVRQALLVNLPYSPVCQPDCAGLCPQCGANLNEEHCGHTLTRPDARLAALAALLDNMDHQRRSG